MKRLFFSILLLLAIAACSSKGKYDVGNYYSVPDQDKVLTAIVTYIFTAPPYTLMKDRFKPEHKAFYAGVAGKFQIEKYFIANDGTHFFYVVRPSPDARDKRGVGGHFKMNDNFEISDFREEFVTPILPESEVKGRCAFLFDEMVKGSLEPHLKMETFVQWPNPVSYYDTITYEWKLKPELEQGQ